MAKAQRAALHSPTSHDPSGIINVGGASLQYDDKRPARRLEVADDLCGQIDRRADRRRNKAIDAQFTEEEAHLLALLASTRPSSSL